MRSIKRHLSPGLVAIAAVSALGFAGPAVAAPAPPDLVPFVDTNSDADNTNAAAVKAWFVETTVSPYSARFHFGTQIANRLTAGPFQIGSDGTAAATAVQVIKDGTPKALVNVRLVKDDFGNGLADWRINGVAAYTLTPSSGAAVNSAIGPFCRVDDGIFEGAPAPAAFDTSGCNSLNSTTAAGFTAGISPGWQDVLPAASSNSAFFNIAGVAPGTATFTATVDPFNEITEVNEGPDSNTIARSIQLPGVSAAPATFSTAATTPVTGQLAASVVAPQVLGKRADQATPVAATAAVTYALASNPANGTAAVTPTGKVTYTARAGFFGADSFAYTATDSRGLQSVPTTVAVTVTGGPVMGGGGVTPGGGGATPPPVVITRLTLKLKPAFSVVRTKGKTYVKVTGTLPTSQAGRTVKIQRKVGKKIKTVAKAKVARNGKYTKLVRFTVKTVSLRTTIAASASAKGSTSAFKSVRLKKK